MRPSMRMRRIRPECETSSRRRANDAIEPRATEGRPAARPPVQAEGRAALPGCRPAAHRGGGATAWQDLRLGVKCHPWPTSSLHPSHSPGTGARRGMAAGYARACQAIVTSTTTHAIQSTTEQKRRTRGRGGDNPTGTFGSSQTESSRCAFGASASPLVRFASVPSLTRYSFPSTSARSADLLNTTNGRVSVGDSGSVVSIVSVPRCTPAGASPRRYTTRFST